MTCAGPLLEPRTASARCLASGPVEPTGEGGVKRRLSAGPPPRHGPASAIQPDVAMSVRGWRPDALVALVAFDVDARLGTAAATYAGALGVALVYLGEQYLV